MFVNPKVLKAWEQPLHRQRKVELLDVFNESFFVKQADHPMQIYDV
jgi:hypothetical protein